MKKQSDAPIIQSVQSVDVPIYFVMEKYDHMTSVKAAKEFYTAMGFDHGATGSCGKRSGNYET